MCKYCSLSFCEENAMQIKPEVLDELLKDYKKPEDVIGESGLPKQ